MIFDQTDPWQLLQETAQRVSQLEHNQTQLVALMRQCQTLITNNQQMIGDLQRQTLCNANTLLVQQRQQESRT